MKPKEKQANPLAPQDDHTEVDLPAPSVENVPADEPVPRIIDTTQKMRAAPDVLDIARRGGLPTDITPYDLGNADGKFYVAASGNSTASVNRYFILGLTKTIEDARELPNQLGRPVNALEAQSLITNLRWLDNWLCAAQPLGF